MSNKPQDAEARRKVKLVICYPKETLPVPELDLYRAARQGAGKVDEMIAVVIFTASFAQLNKIKCIQKCTRKTS